jgi:transcriptional regulator with XRE-family HTH domain
MDDRVRQVKTLFSKELERRCSEKYHKFPSNEKLARDLCLTSKYHLKVSRETIRKWLKGDTFPDLDCLLHLIEWLQLDMRNIFLCTEDNPDIPENLHTESDFSDQKDISENLNVEQINLIIKVLKSQETSQRVETQKKSNSNF